MRVLLIGSGGREHALAAAFRRSPRLTRLYAAPGNAGIAELCRCVAIDPADHDRVLGFCREETIDLVVVGPEKPLVAGLVDRLAAAGIAAFGPTREAAELEGSKGFTKDLCREVGIPTADYRRFDAAGAARAYVAGHRLPVVVKADGLAAGKGVTVATDRRAATDAVDDVFAEPGASLVVEEFLDGEEASFFALCDGETIRPFGTAQDYKRLLDGDLGPNTGGMGATSPAPILPPELQTLVMNEIVRPTIKALARRGVAYRGVLYAGLMLTADGPKLIEYNCRFGDPETQALLQRLDGDLLDILHATATGRLDRIAFKWTPDTAVCVVMTAEGYPGDIRRGDRIEGIAAASALPSTEVFHAATRTEGDGSVATDGGRVLNIVGVGGDVREARDRAYRGVDAIRWPGAFARRDIAWRALVSQEPEGVNGVSKV